MKKETDLKTTFTYNNEFRWGYVIQMFEFLLAITIYDVILTIIVNVCIGGENIITWGDLRSTIVICVFVLLYCVPKYFKRFRTGEYAIIGNELVVREKFFSHEAKLVIPISRISNVGFTPKFTDIKEISKHGIILLITPYRLLEITVEGQKYVLYAYAHAKELHAELNKRINVSQ